MFYILQIFFQQPYSYAIRYKYISCKSSSSQRLSYLKIFITKILKFKLKLSQQNKTLKSQKMDLPPYDKFLKLLKTTMWLEGIAYGNSKIEKRFYIIACILIVMVFSEAAFFFLNMSSENFIELAQSAPCVSNGVLSVSKGIQIGVKRVKIFQLCESLRKLYDLILVDPKKRQLVRRDLVVISMLLKPYFILNVILISIYNFSTLGDMLYHYLTTNKITLMLPFFAWKPFATDTFLPWFLYYSYSAFCGK